MTDDIVERLRSVGRDYDFHENAYIYEAADEIERLRAALQKIAQHDMQAIAIERLRAALRTIADGKRDADQSYATLFAEVVREARAALLPTPSKGGDDGK